MSKSVAYYMPWRKPYEVYAASTWLLSALLGAFIAWAPTKVPPEPIYLVAAFCLVMALYRVVPGIKMWRVRAAMSGKGLDFVTLDDIEKRRRDDALWIGWGFEWTQREAQLTSEVMGRDLRALGLAVHNNMGAPWIHGIGEQEKPYYLALDELKQHAIIVGTTGTGKTRMLALMVSQVIARGDAVVVIDPKSDVELKQALEQACERYRTPGTFKYLNLAYPERSMRMSPTRTWNRSTEIANRIASLIQSETGNDPFKAFSQMTLDKVVQGMLAARMSITLVNIRRAIDSPEAVLERVFERYFADQIGAAWKEELAPLVKVGAADKRVLGYIRYYRQHFAEAAPLLEAEGLISMVEHDREHLNKMIASLMPVLNILTSAHLASLLSPSNEDPDDPRETGELATILRKGEVLYIGLDSLADAMTGSAVGSLFLAELTSVAAARYNYGGGDEPRVWVFVDESAEVVNGESFVQLLNKSRGANFSVVPCTQTIADFAARLGNQDKARQVLANINAKIILRVNDGETQEYLSEGLLGVQIDSVQVSHNEHADADHPILFGAGYGERHTSTEGELIPPGVFGEIPNLEYFVVVGGQKIKGRLPILVDGKKAD